MRKTLFVLLAALVLAVPVLGNAFAWIDLFPIVNGSYQSTCNFNEPASAGLRQVAVVLNSSGDSFTGVRFAVSESGINWLRFGISTPYQSVGSFSDFSIGFGTCLTPPAVIATLEYVAPNHSPCGTIRVVAPPQFASPFGNNCLLDEINLDSRHMTVNGVFDAAPGSEDPSCFCPPLPTQPSTWGRVKALYRE
jgi:hypothetical protein